MASKIWKYIKPIIDAIIFSNLWIALAALSLFSVVVTVNGETENFYEAITIFSSTFIGYNFLKLKGIEHVANDSLFFNWMRKYKWVVYSLIMIAFISLIIAVFHLSVVQITACIISVFVSLIYVGFEKYNLRHFWYLKTPIVAFVWAFFIVALALINAYSTIDFQKVFYLFMACFLFIQGLTIPFEIRDLKADKEAIGLKTIPMVFGIKGTKILAIFHLILALIFFIIYDCKLLILLPIYIIAIIVIALLKQNSSEYNYTFILDGLIILCYPLVYLVY